MITNPLFWVALFGAFFLGFFTSSLFCIARGDES